MSDDVKAAPQEPGACPFCAWDHPGDPPHSESCVIGRHVAFAAEAERAAIVADLRARSQRRSITDFESAILLAEAGRLERGEHEEGRR